ncbi:MAG: NB-ARC domain-containing protein [Pseudolysinimonas sp.]
MPAAPSERDESDRAHATPVRLSVFGALSLEVAGVAVPLSPPRVAQVLAVLGLAGGEPVRIDDLVDALWGEDPPASARNQLHRLVGQARRALEPLLHAHAAGTLVVGSGTTYRLAVHSDGLDLLEFRRVLREARAAAPEARLRGYLEALAIAKVPAGTDLADDGVIGALKRGIERERVQTLIDAASLASNDRDTARELLEVAGELAERHPLDEAVQEAVARLLLATGHRTRALDLIRATEDRLGAELGVGASQGLKSAYVDALRADDGESGAEPWALPLPVALRSLYIQRPEHGVLLDAAADEAARGGSLAVVSGMGGIGKTTLVAEWARGNATRFRDGVLYFDAHGMNPATRAADVVEAMTAVLRALGEQKHGRPSPEEYRAAVGSRDVLLILDNVPGADFVRELLPLGGRSLVIAISRSALPGLIAREGAFALSVGILTDRQAIELLAMRLGRQGSPPTPGTVERLVAACGGLPLALTVAAARGMARQHGGITAIADEVERATRRLDPLSAGSADASVRVTLSWSVDRLSDGAKSLFGALSVYPGATWSIEAAESLHGTDRATTNAAVTELLGANLLGVDDRGRLQMHDLLRELGAESLDDLARIAAERRLVQHFVRTGYEATRLCLGRILDLTGIPTGPAENFGGAGEATEWFDDVRQVVREVIRIAVLGGWDLEVALLGAGYSFMINRIFDFERDLPLFEAFLEPSLRSGRGVLAMAARTRLAERYEASGRFEEAELLWEDAIAWARSEGTDEDLADALRLRGAAALHRRDHDLEFTIGILRESLEAARRARPGSPAVPIGLIFYGDALRQAGRLEAAIDAFAEIGTLPSPPPFYRAVSYSFLAMAYLELDRLPEAIEAAQISIPLIPAAGSGSATLAFQVIATAALRLGDTEQAAKACTDFRTAWSDEALDTMIARQAASGEDVHTPFATAPIVAEISRVEAALDG